MVLLISQEFSSSTTAYHLVTNNNKSHYWKTHTSFHFPRDTHALAFTSSSFLLLHFSKGAAPLPFPHPCCVSCYVQANLKHNQVDHVDPEIMCNGSSIYIQTIHKLW